MNTHSSLNAFNHPVVHMGKERKRLYSWSRPSKYLPRKSQAQSELIIKGRATLAFSPDGKWFQGNIISPTADAYTISGRRKSLSTSLEPVREPGDTLDQSSCISHSYTSPPSLPSSPASCPTNQTSLASADSDQPYPSDTDSLDYELVRAVIENFSIEDEDCDALYDLAIMDYETGINHSVKRVGCQVSSDMCRLMGDTLTFQADTCNKGAMADMVIHKNIGQAMTEQSMTVFQGEFSYTYSDLICFPIPQGEGQGQWCL
eukprot:GFUD01106246.1.p1 GENE.GFUD01106246.1~~GFUD01106246.1.p1  ORF type:complete len:260 (+),score=73.14 GFUD01106246.1:47-826(+)